MKYSSQQILEAYASLSYQTDVRNAPEGRRRGNFRAGWKDAAQREKQYKPSALNTLTWQNLGYRLGLIFGDIPDSEIDAAFNLLASQFHKSR